jgi:large subunit ribosomal protein L6
MASAKPVEEKIAIPSGITLSESNGVVSVSGPKGKNSKALRLRNLAIKVSGGEVVLKGPLRELSTARAHILNMINGSQNGYVQKMKIIYAHFPIAIELKGKEIMVKNFVGEKQPRRCAIVGDTKVEAKPPAVTVSGPSREDVGQTVANIRSATKIKNSDSRIFQDGIYPVEE